MQFFQRIFAVTVMKVYTKMLKLWVHLGYYHLHISLASKKGKFQLQTNIFPGNNSPFSIKPSTAVWIKISQKKPINFYCWKSLHLFPVGQNNGVQIRAFDATRGISR